MMKKIMKDWIKLVVNNSLKIAIGVVYVRPEEYENKF